MVLPKISKLMVRVLVMQSRHSMPFELCKLLGKKRLKLEIMSAILIGLWKQVLRHIKNQHSLWPAFTLSSLAIILMDSILEVGSSQN